MTTRKLKKGRIAKRDLQTLEAEYSATAPLAGRFGDEIGHQLQQLIDGKAIALSLPIQKRTKTWSSIVEKLERKSIDIANLRQLNDLVGLRIIVQFSRDLITIRELIRSNFKVVEEYDTGDRLKEDQFGYSSVHFVVELPDSWLSVPTMSSMNGLRAEIQLRTTAQHIWAAASHTLQYKHEASVPSALRRAIHRVSALLETVDLEFDRVLQERDVYRSTIDLSSKEATLNVDILERILDSTFPEVNKRSSEPYAQFLAEVTAQSVTTAPKLEALLKKYRDAALAEDLRIVELLRSNGEGHKAYKRDEERLSKGIFYSHVGLARFALGVEWGQKWHWNPPPVTSEARVTS